MYELLKTDSKIRISEALVDDFKEINASLAEACGLALRQPIAGKQYVLMTDASFRASGNALMIEENVERKLLSEKKTFAPVAFGSRVFSPAQLKMSIYCKSFWLYNSMHSLNIVTSYGQRRYRHWSYHTTVQ